MHMIRTCQCTSVENDLCLLYSKISNLKQKWCKTSIILLKILKWCVYTTKICMPVSPLFILQVLNLSCRFVEKVFLSDLSKPMVLCFFSISFHAWNLRIGLLPLELELLSNCVLRYIDEIHMKHWHWENLSTVIFEFGRSNSSFHWRTSFSSCF
jgi:hypothetical protein